MGRRKIGSDVWSASLHISPPFITPLILGVFGAGFIEEIRRIAVVDRIWIEFTYSIS